MNKDDLKKIKYDDLKNIAKDMDIEIPRSKDKLIDSMIKCFEEYEKYKKNKIDKYEKIKQLGEKGKEGITYLVKTSKGKEYAMKTFKKNKSSSKLKKEAKLQEMASEYGVCPKIVEIDTVSKYIVMEKLDTHLLDIIKKQNRDITKSQQKQIISIFKGLDKAKVFHGDSNILNYMFKDKKLYIIDFGMSKEIDDKLIKKLGTDTPNLHLMNLGFILKLKELQCLESSYSHLLTYVSDTEKEKFNL
jgi:tRNA A-37 threonylcarbamoyl transferase component Bud32